MFSVNVKPGPVWMHAELKSSEENRLTVISNDTQQWNILFFRPIKWNCIFFYCG